REGFAMGRPHPIELRRRVVDFVEEGHSHRSTAAHFRVSVRFVNDMVKLKRETGSLAPKRQGNPGRGKLADVQPWVRAYVLREKDPTLNELVVALREHHGIEVERSSVCRLLQRLGLTYKKKISARLSRSGRMCARPGSAGSSGVSPSCAVSCPVSASSTRRPWRPTCARPADGRRAGGTARRPCALRPLEHPNLHRHLAPRPSGCAVGAQWTDEPRALRDLRRHPTRPNAEPG